jgi:hypothetical protein
MAGSAKLQKIVHNALVKADELGLFFDKVGMRDFVKVFGGEGLDELLAAERDSHLDAVILSVRQGAPDQPPLFYYVRSKGGAGYPSRSIATSSHKNQYIRRANKNMVARRDKAKITVDQIKAAGDRAESLFIVGPTEDDEANETVTVKPMTLPRLQVLFPEWFLEDQFGDDDEDDGPQEE